jgi:hypothetical protein
MTLPLLKLLVALTEMVNLGYLLCRLLRLNEHRPWFERLALWFLTGTGVVSLMIFYLSLANPETGLRFAAIVGTLALAYSGISVVLRWARRPGDLPRFPLKGRRNPGYWISVALALALLFQVSTIAYASLNTGLEWDGYVIWGLKAKAVFVGGGVSPSYFQDLSRQWSHLDYPLLIPLSEAWIYSFLGGVDESSVKALFIGFLLSLLALLYGGFRRNLPAPYSLGCVLVLCLTPSLLLHFTTGYADVPLSVFVLGSVVYLAGWRQSRRSSDLLLSGVLSMLGIWCKREGSLLWGLELALLAIWVWNRLEWRRALRALATFALPALFVVPWFAFVAYYKVPGNDFAAITPDALLSQVGRLPTILSMVGKELALSGWGALWVLCALSLVFPRDPRLSGLEKFIAALVIGYLGALSLSFMLSVWQPFTRHIEFSAGRLVLHVAPAAAFFLTSRLKALLPGQPSPLPREMG